MKIKKKKLLMSLICGIVILLIIYVWFVLSWEPMKVKHDRIIRSAENKILTLETAISMYYTDLGVYPPSGNANLIACLQTKSGKGPYINLGSEEIKNNQLLDPWGNPYSYIQPGIHNTMTYDIYSFGPNGRDDKGMKDDIKNW